MHVIDKLVGLRPFADDGLAITFLPAACDSAREVELFRSLRDVAELLDKTPAIQRLVIDCQHLRNIPDEARGAVVKLLLQFDKREGAVICAAQDSALEPFALMRLAKFFTRADSLSLPPAQRELIEICDEMTASLDVQRLTEERMSQAAAEQIAPPRSVLCNGNLIFYAVQGNTAEVRLNADILKLDEEAAIASRFKEAVTNVSESEPEVERILLNLRGLEFMGADSIGALISIHNAGKSGRGARLALANIEAPLAEKLAMCRLDHLFTIFPHAEDGLTASW